MRKPGKNSDLFLLPAEAFPESNSSSQSSTRIGTPPCERPRSAPATRRDAVVRGERTVSGVLDVILHRVPSEPKTWRGTGEEIARWKAGTPHSQCPSLGRHAKDDLSGKVPCV